MKVAINACYGGFGLSDAAYEWLIREKGLPVRAYAEQERDPVTGLYLDQPLNDGEVLFDREASAASELDAEMSRMCGRFWETGWLTEDRKNTMLIEVIEALGAAANGRFANLKIVDVPDDVEWQIEEYAGYEHVAQNHMTWG
jgi:hypothetical protein